MKKIINDQKGNPWLVATSCSRNACSKCCYSEFQKDGYYHCHADKGMTKGYIPPCDETGVGFLCYFTKFRGA